MKQFDGIIIKVMVTVKRTFETKIHFELIPITRVACNKDQGPLGIDMMKVDSKE